MFRPMRRFRQELSCDETKKILQENGTCTLALLGDEGYPYSVPMNYYYDGEDKIYFHCAKQGHKIDAIKSEEKVSLSVISKNEVYEEKFTTLFESVVVFGRAKILEDTDEIKAYCARLAERLCPNNVAKIPEEINSASQNMTIVEITIEHMSGKECIEFTKQRNA